MRACTYPLLAFALTVPPQIPPKVCFFVLLSLGDILCRSYVTFPRTELHMMFVSDAVVGNSLRAYYLNLYMIFTVYIT